MIFSASILGGSTSILSALPGDLDKEEANDDLIAENLGLCPVDCYQLGVRGGTGAKGF
jgi:hypothetical protein